MTSIWTVSLILGFSLTEAPFSDARHVLRQPKPLLTVVVRDTIDIDPADRDIARAEATRILDKAGVEMRWIDASPLQDPHIPSETKDYVTVVIASQPPDSWPKPDQMGFALVRPGDPHPRAYVFSRSMTAFLRKHTIEDKSSFGILLGHAIVHELGHLLISGDAHGNGIMQTGWGYPEWKLALEGSLLFSAGHAQTIRKALQSGLGKVRTR